MLILSHEAERQDVAICFDVPDGLGVTGDPEDLKEMFFNLILNGIQAMEGHHENRRLTLMARQVFPYVEVRVADTGPGISAVDQARIFRAVLHDQGVGHRVGARHCKTRCGAHGRVHCRDKTQSHRARCLRFNFPEWANAAQNFDSR